MIIIFYLNILGLLKVFKVFGFYFLYLYRLSRVKIYLKDKFKVIAFLNMNINVFNN